MVEDADICARVYPKMGMSCRDGFVLVVDLFCKGVKWSAKYELMALKFITGWVNSRLVSMS
jgi:hypothetical protein